MLQDPDACSRHSTSAQHTPNSEGSDELQLATMCFGFPQSKHLFPDSLSMAAL